MGDFKKHTWKRVAAVAVAFAMAFTSLQLSPYSVGVTDVEAAGYSGTVLAPTEVDLGKASISPEVVGTWSYWDGSQTVVKTNASLLEKLPYEGSAYRFTTDNYDATHGALDTTDWASSFIWSVNGNNPYSSTAYAIPLAFRASVEGGISNCIQVTASSALSDYVNNTYTMQMPANGSCTDFFIETPFKTSSAKVDAISDWAYDVILEDSSDFSRYMKTTMVQGSIFAYFELVNANSVIIERGKQLPASVVYTSTDGKVIVVRCYDNAEEDYDYYAFYGANGTTWNVTTDGSYISKITSNFSGNTYFSLAYLGSSKGSPNDTWGSNMANVYYPYAYNFVTNTQANYSYDEATSTVTTVYSYALEKKAESTADGTVMGVLPHQYKNMTDTNFLPYTYETIRGTLKLKAGSSFTTYLKYSGILPYMPDMDSAYDSEALEYLDLYIDDFGDDFFANYEGAGDTYWDGKGLNRLMNAMAVAYDADDTATGDYLLGVLQGELENWFTYSGSDDDAYFYYDEGVGTLFGFPQSYYSVDQMNDHHFHYGYFIYAAAQVAMRVEGWGDDSQYGAMVKQLIFDIANPERNSADSPYPYLRGFAPYEGHSWASGPANFEMGNNQESSSEALNAWAGIILWAEATGDTELRNLGIYLYTTEASAVDNYWYDVDGDILHDAYKYDVPLSEVGNISNSADVVHNSAAIVWGGSYTYATWFDGNPLYIQGINLIPMNPTGFYLAGDKDYIRMNYDNAYKNAAAAGADLTAWSDIYAQYLALADPDAALDRFNTIVAEGHGVEGGDSRAHTYHFIQSLRTHGTPDTTITSDTALSTVFCDEATGVYTYVVYNASDAAKPVTFSDGTVITAAANDMTIVKGNEISDRASYTVNHYTQNADGSYSLYKTANQYGTIGNTVTAAWISIDGYTCDTGISGTVTSGVVNENDSLTLSLYYTRNTYSISYELNGGTNHASNPSSYTYGTEVALYDPAKSDCTFTGWYTDSALSQKVTSVSAAQTGDLTLYAGWADVYGDSVDAYKGLTYSNGKLSFYVKNIDPSNQVLLYTNFYASEASANSLTNEAGVAGLRGYTMTYDSAADMWTYAMDVSNYAGYYIPYRFNVVYASGVGELSAWGVYQIPAEASEDNTPSETESSAGDSSSPSEEDITVPSISTDDYVYDAQAGTVTFTLNDSASKAIIYLATYSSESAAVSAYNTAIKALPGISLPGHAGYYMTSADGVHTYVASMAEETWFVYGFNALGTSGFETWKLGVAQVVTEEGSTEESTELSEEESSPEESSENESTETLVKPSKVTGVQAVYENGQIKVTWDDNGAVQYRVMRFTSEIGYKTMTYKASSAGYVDTDLIEAQLYYYRICGYFYDADGNLVQGSVSDSVAVVATDKDPAQVTNLSAAINDGAVTLTWDVAEGVRYYKIARAYGWTTADGSYSCLKYNVSDTTYTDTPAYKGKWRYKVVGYYKDTDGSWVYGAMSSTLFLTVE